MQRTIRLYFSLRRCCLYPPALAWRLARLYVGGQKQ